MRLQRTYAACGIETFFKIKTIYISYSCNEHMPLAALKLIHSPTSLRICLSCNEHMPLAALKLKSIEVIILRPVVATNICRLRHWNWETIQFRSTVPELQRTYAACGIETIMNSTVCFLQVATNICRLRHWNCLFVDSWTYTFMLQRTYAACGIETPSQLDTPIHIECCNEHMPLAALKLSLKKISSSYFMCCNEHMPLAALKLHSEESCTFSLSCNEHMPLAALKHQQLV